MFEENKPYYVRIYDALSGKIETVCVTNDIFNVMDGDRKREDERKTRAEEWAEEHPDKLPKPTFVSLDEMTEQGREFAASDSVEDIAEENATHEFVHRIVRELPRGEHDIIDGYYFQDLSEYDISAMTGIPRQTVYSRRKVILKNLRKKFK